MMDRRSVMSALVVPFAAGSWACRTAWAAGIDAAWMLQGAWLVSVGDGKRDRFLLLKNLQDDGREVRVGGASYGWIDGTGSSIKDWKATVDGEVVRVRFSTPADSRIEFVLRAEDATVQGEMTTSKGKTLPVRLTRLSSQELTELRSSSQFDARLKGLRLTRETRIRLLYVGAPDCPSCRGYEVEYFGRKNLMAEKLPEFSELDYVKAQLVSYKAKGLASVLPPDLAPLATAGAKGEAPQLRQNGTPFFALIVDQRVLGQVHGVSSFESVLIPQIRKVVATRRAVAVG